MGISALFSSFAKGVTWSKVAGMAMEYGPELYRKALERLQSGATVDAAEEAALQERVARLEKLLLEQEEVIRGQAARNELLEKNCLLLEHRLLVFQITAAALALGCIILLAILFK